MIWDNYMVYIQCYQYYVVDLKIIVIIFMTVNIIMITDKLVSGAHTVKNEQSF